MVDEKKGDDKDKSNAIAENAATTYGLEDHEATQQDPRVSELMQSRSHQQRKSLQPVTKSTPTPRLLSGHPSQENTKKNAVAVAPTGSQHGQETNKKIDVIPDDAPSTREPAQLPKTVPVEKPPLKSKSPQMSESPSTKFHSIVSDEVDVASEKGKVNTVSTLTNTDITFDPSKQYASKTTNTSGQLYTDVGETGDEAQAPEPQPQPPVKVSAFDLDECYAFAVALVRKAGAHALAANSKRLSYTTKEHEKDLNTLTDTEVEEMFTKAISEKYPDHKIIAEEAVSSSETGQVTLTTDPTWIIDPIDGTMNYVHHFPYYCIALAFLIDKKTEFGIVFNPPLQEFYTARKGMGAKLNDYPMTTSGQDSLKSAMVLQEYSSGMNEARTVTSLENAKTLIKKTHALRSIGSSAMGLAMVASGVADAFYFFGLHVWDMAAGNILVTEAGGTIIDPSGGEVDIMSRRVLAAATLPLALELSSQLQQNFPSPRDDESRKVAPLMKDFQAQTDFSETSLSLDSDSSRQTNIRTVK